MIEKVRFPPTWSLFDIHSLDSSTVMLGLGINLQSWHHLNQCTAETKEIPEVEDGECCIFVLIENKIKSVEFDVWARSDSIQVVQSLSKAGGAENEACRSETFEVWRKKGKCVLFKCVVNNCTANTRDKSSPMTAVAARILPIRHLTPLYDITFKSTKSSPGRNLCFLYIDIPTMR